VGLERDRAGLEKALTVIAAVERAANGEPALLNMAASAKLAAAAALARHESRGGHFRSDYPQTDETGVRTYLTLSDADAIAAGASETASPACAAC
jgi:L-aspartate oxidase